VVDDLGFNGLLSADRGTLASELPRPDEGFRAKRSQQPFGLAADGITPLWEPGPWSDDGETPWIRGKDGDLRRMYGLTIEWWVDLLEAQNWRCAACKRTFRFTFQCPPGYPRPPHVDHDHQTGEIRGLLCGRCNRKLSQGLTRYVLNPPARRLGPWVMPAKQRQYGLELFAKRVRRQLQARDLAALANSTGSGP
jgi:hypothetical protein